MSEDTLQFEAGTLSRDEVKAILDTLPIEITFVNDEDTIKYFNKFNKRIFARSRSIIGSRVQQCHPQKIVHVVDKILDSFRSGKKDVAEFWIKSGDRLIYIRYFAVRDKDGKYLGTMEVAQDVTEIKKIEGEKRLLDWED